MRYIDVGDDYVASILEANKLSSRTLNEEMCPSKHGDSKKKKMEKKDKPEKNDQPEREDEMYGMGKKKKMKKMKVESTDLHECPLCESQLEEPLTVDQLQEHIEFILDTINEAEEFEGEEINEEEDQNSDDEDGEDDDEDED